MYMSIKCFCVIHSYVVFELERNMGGKMQSHVLLIATSIVVRQQVQCVTEMEDLDFVVP